MMGLEEIQIKIRQQFPEIVGSKTSEIEEVEKELNVRLPEGYKSFLQLAGKNQGQIFDGDNILLQELKFIQSYCKVNIYSNALGIDCPSSLFFILLHQNYSCYYFDINSGEDPDVWVLVYGEEIIHEKKGSLSSVLTEELEKVLLIVNSEKKDGKVRKRILTLFSDEQEKSGLEFEESHFMDFLTNPPHPKNSIKNSFKGVRKYYSLMNKIELEFGICFGLPDLDRYYSVDSLTKKIQDKIGNKRSNKMILQRRLEEKENYKIEVAVAVIAVLSYFIIGINWFSIILTFISILVIKYLLRKKSNERIHNRQLKKIID